MASKQNIAADSRTSPREATDQQHQKTKASHHENEVSRQPKHDTAKPAYLNSKHIRIRQQARMQQKQKYQRSMAQTIQDNQGEDVSRKCREGI